MRRYEMIKDRINSIADGVVKQSALLRLVHDYANRSVGLD